MHAASRTVHPYVHNMYVKILINASCGHQCDKTRVMLFSAPQLLVSSSFKVVPIPAASNALYRRCSVTLVIPVCMLHVTATKRARVLV
jgi:hypothetical protein